MAHWLVKSEPNAFSFDDLMASKDRTTTWDGVRNYQARNFIRDGMRPGDDVLYYHSQTTVPGVVGIAKVTSDPYPDASQFDPRSRYYDPKATTETPRWFAVDVTGVEALPRVVALAELKAEPALAGMEVVRRGSRLSVMPVSATEFRRIVAMSKQPAPDS